jgi:hypothetical protein
MEVRGEKIEGLPLVIDPEFNSLCWKLTEEELSFLISSIKKDGCREPIRYWECDGKRLIIDGQNRYEICLKVGKLYETINMEFTDRQAAIEWIIKNQLGRRNATEVQKSGLRAKLYLQRKDAEDFDCTRCTPSIQVSTLQDIKDQKPSGQPKPRRQSSLAKDVAKETGVSERTIHHDVEFDSAMTKLAQKSPTLRDDAMKSHINKRDAMVVADASMEVIRKLEASPEPERRACVKAAAEAMKDHKPSRSGRPIVFIKALSDLEKAAGKLTQAKTAALEACGGKAVGWAWEHHEKLRLTLIPVFDSILDWQKEAESHNKEAA